MAALEPTLEEQRRVEAATQRRAAPLETRELVAEVVLGGGFLAACVALFAAVPPNLAELHLEALAACALTLAVAVRVRFVVGAGYTVPTQLAFVPLLFVAPPALVAPLVALVLAAGQLPAVLGGRLPAGRLLLAAANAWFSIGPAIVLALAGTPDAAHASAAIVAAMLVAQVTVDAVSGACRELLHGTFDRRALLGEGWIYGVDAALTPVAFVAAIVATGRPWVVLAMDGRSGPGALLARAGSRTGLTELNDAYRGIVHRTRRRRRRRRRLHGRALTRRRRAGGAWSATGCADAERLRDLEFGALLHDIGKVAIPKAIINKPGKLDRPSGGSSTRTRSKATNARSRRRASWARSE